MVTPQPKKGPTPGPERPRSADAPASGSVLREFAEGARFLGRGLAMWGRSPKLLLTGAIPALISFILLAGAFAVLAFEIDEIIVWATPFADGWAAVWQVVTRIVVGVAVLGAALLLAIVTYTALTLLIGEPFYEKISQRVEQKLGGAPAEPETPWWRSLAREVRDSLRVLLVSFGVSVLLLVGGFVPVAGQTVVPVAGLFVGGWFLVLELAGIPYARRGLRLDERRRHLKRHRSLALGFGVSAFLLFLIPLGAVVVMPAAVAGGTLLAREVLDAEFADTEASGSEASGSEGTRQAPRHVQTT